MKGAGKKICEIGGRDFHRKTWGERKERVREGGRKNKEVARVREVAKDTMRN